MTVEEATPGSLAQSAMPRELDWNSVYRDQLPRLYNYFRFRTGQDADVQDLTARTFEKAWKARHRYHREACPSRMSEEFRRGGNNNVGAVYP